MNGRLRRENSATLPHERPKASVTNQNSILLSRVEDDLIRKISESHGMKHQAANLPKTDASQVFEHAPPVTSEA